jgi:hypothetical protein
MNNKIKLISEKLADERSRKVLFLSHCALNENTRYLGGAFCPGISREVLKDLNTADYGVVQLPCPEQAVWGGVYKRLIWLSFGAEGKPSFFFGKPFSPFSLYIQNTGIRG